MIFINRLMSIAILALFSHNAHSINMPEIGNLYDRFKNEYKFLSPAAGVLVLKSHILNNIVTYGNYGKETESFLCHKQITERETKCPRDNTTAFIQQLFPTPAGGRLAVSGSDSDFFRNLTMADIGLMLKVYVKYGDDGEKMAELLNSEESDFLSSINKNKRRAIVNNFKTILKDRKITNITEVVAIIAGMLAKAHQEQANYPAHIVEHTLLAFAVHKANQISDLRPLLDQLSDFQHSNYVAPVPYFNKDAYEEFKGYIADGELASSFEPADLILTTLAYDEYDDPFPRMIGTGESVYQGIKFSDCGERFLGNLMNIFLSNPKDKSFSLDYLLTAFPNASASLKRFYSETQKNYEDVDKQKSRQAWAEVVSNLNVGEGIEVTYAFPKEKPVCNILAVGIDNILAALERLLMDPNITALRTTPTEGGLNDKRVSILNYIFSKFSRPDLKFDWVMERGGKYLPQHGHEKYNFYITVNGGKDFKATIGGQQHYDLEKNLATNKGDWRKKTSNKFFNSIAELPNGLNHLLLPFYLRDVPIEELLSLQKDLGPTILFGWNLDKPEGKLSALNMTLFISDAPAATTVVRWLKSIPEAYHVLNRAITVTLWNFAHYSPDQFEFAQELPDLYKKYLADLEDLNSQPQMLLRYLSYVYAEPMVFHYLTKLNREQIVTIKSGDHSLLTIAAEYGSLTIVDYLLNHVPELAKDVALAKHDFSGLTPLRAALYNGNQRVVELLLAKAPHLATDKKFAKGGLIGENALHYALRGEANIDTIASLLKVAPELITDKNLALDDNKTSPLDLAALFEKWKAVQLIVKYMSKEMLEAEEKKIENVTAKSIIKYELRNRSNQR